MKSRAFFLASTLLVGIALGLHFGALTQIQNGLLQRGRSVTAAAEQKQQMRADADLSFNRGSVFGSSGLCLACGSVYVAYRKNGRSAVCAPRNCMARSWITFAL